ncbi:sigma factor-like helix-turn-helix DNA-binding protein [Geodermatophilus obscurus]|uniref:sigma factor-like helix-turn-helix DNA-binding protein n=1 Tax=Geodermatophilus obscurus TaxID=1861 RepID=UPI00019B821D|nr:sigma factor-like helix-turn-helix DNA-binding protein [Geodermatophilus obscurus]
MVVRDARAYLVRIATRQALDRMRTLARRREEYVGEWLPEPLLTNPDVAEDVELAESVPIAMPTVLETFRPTERAVLVLHEVFDVSHDEIAEAVGESSAAVRQIAHRAREHVAARRPRMVVTRAEQQRVEDRFLAALTAGCVQGLMDALAPDVVVVADSGDLAPAARRPVAGRKRVPPRCPTSRSWRPGVEITTPLTNGAVAARIHPGGEFDTAITFVVEDGCITRTYAMRNPHELGRLDAVAELRR